MKKISLSTSFFDDNKLKAMSLTKNSDTALLLYFKLLFGACRDDSDGKLMLFDDVAYDEKAMSGVFNIPEKTVSECLALLMKFGLIAKTDDCYVISNFIEIVGRDSRESHSNSQRKYAAKRKDEVTGTITATEA